MCYALCVFMCVVVVLRECEPPAVARLVGGNASGIAPVKWLCAACRGSALLSAAAMI